MVRIKRKNLQKLRIGRGLGVAIAGKKGRGVFATKAFRSGEVIELAPYVEVPKSDSSHIEQTVLNHYWYEVDESTFAIGLGFTSLYNHSEKPNAEFDFDKKSKRIMIRATRPIAPGKEITIHYGCDISVFLATGGK